MTVKEYLAKTCNMHYSFGMEMVDIRNRAECEDGFTISIQASEFHYCTPRTNLSTGNYDTVELGFPSEADELITEYAENPDNLTRTVYGYVPIEIVDELIKKHGGFKL